MRQIHEQQMLQMKAMLDQVVTNLSSGMGTQIHVKELDERCFRELWKFEGQDDHWKEWSLKFRAKIKELNMTLFNDLTWAEDEITITDVDQKAWCRWGEEGCRDLQPVDSAFGQSCAHHSSVGARRKWIRSLENIGAPLQPIDPCEGAPNHVAVCGAWQDQKGPGLPNAREHMGRMGKQAGEGLQGQEVKDKMVGLLDARARLKDPNAIDIGFAGEDDWWWDDEESSDVDVAAIGKGDHCFRCGEVGHIANECPTPKGKGKGKEVKGFNSDRIILQSVLRWTWDFFVHNEQCALVALDMFAGLAASRDIVFTPNWDDTSGTEEEPHRDSCPPSSSPGRRSSSDSWLHRDRLRRRPLDACDAVRRLLPLRWEAARH